MISSVTCKYSPRKFAIKWIWSNNNNCWWADGAGRTFALFRSAWTCPTAQTSAPWRRKEAVKRKSSTGTVGFEITRTKSLETSQQNFMNFPLKVKKGIFYRGALHHWLRGLSIAQLVVVYTHTVFQGTLKVRLNEPVFLLRTHFQNQWHLVLDLSGANNIWIYF